MSEVLFEGYDPEVVEPEQPMSADRRRTKRQAEAVAAGRHPLTGGRLHELASRHRDSAAPATDPFTCGSCWFRESLGHRGKSYAKCVQGDGKRVTHGASTDVRAWWPACPDYSPSDSLSPDAARSIPSPEALPQPTTSEPESAR